MKYASNPASETGLNQTDYMKLFLQELTYQDPMKPVDNREFMAQMAHFSLLQEARTTNDSLRLLAGMASASQSLMLLGKQVKISGENTQGIVRKIQFPGGEAPLLTISVNGVELKKQLTDISEVW